MKEMTKIWEDSGLLYGLSDEQKNELSTVFETFVNRRKTFNTKENCCETDTIFFPIVFRIYNSVNVENGKVGKFEFIVDIDDLFYDIKEEWKKFNMVRSELYYYLIDKEAEFCSYYSQNYVEDLKKRRII